MTSQADSADSAGGTAAKQIAVFLLDDHEVARRGVRDIKVVGEAGTASSALARIPALRPDVAVLDVRLPDGDGVTVCREIRSQLPEVACLMLTSFGDDDALFDAIMAGAAGYVLKQIRGTDLVGAVRTVASGQSMLDASAAGQVMARLRNQPARHDPLAGLTPQERRILELIGEGLTNRQIGERMFLAEKTVKNYVSGLFAKLGMQRRTQAAAYAGGGVRGPGLRRVRRRHDASRRALELGTLYPRPGPRAGGILDDMDLNGSVPGHLSRGECMRLMGSVPLGRIVYTRQALPAVELVNFALDDGDVIIATNAGGKLAAATRGAVVAFEADSVDVAASAGWSVTVVGYSRAVTDDAEIGRLNRVGLVPWAPGTCDHFIRISPTIVHGRRLGAAVMPG
jgi:DNA-binding NarL/FixJ family response regulator